MSRNVRFTAAAALLGLVGTTATAAAQTTANASAAATAFVQGIAPLTATQQNDLNFGTVTAGTPKTVTNLAADAARFAVTGEPSFPVTVSYLLPTVLTGAGGATIPISFGASDGIQWVSFPATFTTFNPNAAFLTALDVAGNLVVGVTGTVSPPLGTTTGTYTGTITLTVSY
jgi:hypothetical protein